MTRRGERFGKKRREATFGGIDFGQETSYLIWFGSSALTDISGGTKVISVTGMGTLTHFFPSVENGGGATPYHCIVQGYTTNAGVTVAMYRYSGITMPTGVSGTTLHWMAVGTQA
jgi:hypothetical protein